MIDGKVHWFGVAGMANGLAVMRDEETESLWDHITGECFEGPLAGRNLDFWPVSMTTVAAERANHPETILLKSDHRSLISMLMKMIVRRQSLINNKGTFLPPGFRGSMHSTIDSRLPEGEQGLGVMDGLNGGKFYPMRAIPKEGAIEDQWLGRKLRVERRAIDGVPFARWLDDDEPPMQLLTRWYGFSFSYPNCDIYQA